ncbi:hypothetical protein DXG01_010187 [Tephrocybe rancida]|nr:hypothetical protein DXG01_010187 [Tephrocybe rancida]
MEGVKTAMKAKDAVTSTTLRAVLSEVYAADKAANDKVPSSTIATILRRAVVRRTEAAAKFTEASRQDLAKKELQETEILEKFLPALLSETDIDAALREVIGSLPAEAQSKKNLGQVFKLFYQRIDRSTVDSYLVKQRAELLLAQK